MKQRYLFFLVFVLSLLEGCQSGTKEEKILSVTIEPQRYFLENIVEDRYKINVIVPVGASPETYEPTPAMMVKLAKSAIYFKVGFLGFENAWAESLVKNNPDVKVVNCSEGIDLIYGEHHHVSGKPDVEDEHALLPDPHVWLSPKAARVFVENMYRGFITYDSQQKEFYQENFLELTKKITQTDSTITRLLADISSRSFVIYHPALSYFARDYGLKQYSIEVDGKNPSPAQMKALIDIARKEDIRVVFVQQGFDTKNATVIANEIGGKVYVINPLAYEWDKELIRIAHILAGKEE
ncbi:MAG: zinc ABC transporter solute-binding protein [Bacteroidales bacterium]|nr:zinc ABC transporter solute-binding protein [Bacteroidales bacterium]